MYVGEQNLVPGARLNPFAPMPSLCRWRPEKWEKQDIAMKGFQKLKADHDCGRPVNAGSSRFKFLASFEDGPWFSYGNGCQKVEGRETSRCGFPITLKQGCC
jgi:hypothetical protein